VVFSKSSLSIDSNLQGTNLTIPAVFVASSNISSLASSNTITLSPSFLTSSPLYSTPSGLTIVDLRPLQTGGTPSLVSHRTDWFNFSSRFHVAAPYPVLYVVGADALNGGMVVLDIHNPYDPALLGVWSGASLSDVVVASCGNYRLAFCVSTDSSSVFVLDVTDPTNPFLAMYWATPYPPHSSWPDPSCGYLYVVYEGVSIPSDIYSVPSYTPPNLNNTSGNSSTGAISTPAITTFYYPTNRSTVPQELVCYQNFLYIADAGLSLYDITTPSKPSLVARTGSYSSTTFTATTGLYARSARDVYLVDRDRGLFTLQYDQELVVEQVNLTKMSMGATIAAALLSVGLLTIFWVVFVIFRMEHWAK